MNLAIVYSLCMTVIALLVSFFALNLSRQLRRQQQETLIANQKLQEALSANQKLSDSAHQLSAASVQMLQLLQALQDSQTALLQGIEGTLNQKQDVVGLKTVLESALERLPLQTQLQHAVLSGLKAHAASVKS